MRRFDNRMVELILGPLFQENRSQMPLFASLFPGHKTRYGCWLFWPAVNPNPTNIPQPSTTLSKMETYASAVFGTSSGPPLHNPEGDKWNWLSPLKKAIVTNQLRTTIPAAHPPLRYHGVLFPPQVCHT